MDNETKKDGSPSLSSDKNSCSGGPNKEQRKERETFSIKRKAFSHGKERKKRKSSPSLASSSSSESHSSSGS